MIHYTTSSPGSLSTLDVPAIPFRKQKSHHSPQYLKQFWFQRVCWSHGR